MYFIQIHIRCLRKRDLRIALRAMFLADLPKKLGFQNAEDAYYILLLYLMYLCVERETLEEYSAEHLKRTLNLLIRMLGRMLIDKIAAVDAVNHVKSLRHSTNCTGALVRYI